MTETEVMYMFIEPFVYSVGLGVSVGAVSMLIFGLLGRMIKFWHSLILPG